MKHGYVDEELILKDDNKESAHSESIKIKNSNLPTLAIREGRLLSIDVFRGLTLVFMVLVNSPGHPEFAYPPLKHAPWNSWTPTDLVFPLFIFIVGVAQASFGSGKPECQFVPSNHTQICITFFTGFVSSWVSIF